MAQGTQRAAYAQRVLSDPFLKESLTVAERSAYEAAAARTAPARADLFPGLPLNGSNYLRILTENTKQAQAHGVVIAVGSDSEGGIGTHLEMELLQEAGLTPGEVLVAATYGGAVALGVEDRQGTIEPGKLGDLVILSRNPLTDIRNARAVEWIVKGGRPVRQSELAR